VVRELEDAAAQTVGVSATIGLWIEAERTLRFFARETRPRSPSTGQDVSYADDADGGHYDVRPGSMLAGRAFERQELVFAADVLKEDPAYASYYTAAGSQAVMVAPISARQRRLGVLVAHAHRAPMFAQSDLEILQLLANQMAVILDNRLHIEEAVHARAQDEANRLRLLEDERLRIATELHDRVVQTFFGIGMTARGALDQADHQAEAFRSSLAAVRAFAEQGTEQLREAIFALSRPDVQDRGLVPSLWELVRDFRKRACIEADLVVSGSERRVSHETAETLYESLAKRLSTSSATLQRALSYSVCGSSQVRRSSAFKMTARASRRWCCVRLRTAPRILGCAACANAWIGWVGPSPLNPRKTAASWCGRSYPSRTRCHND
jgi:GAF domain-containing protein